MSEQDEQEDYDYSPEILGQVTGTLQEWIGTWIDNDHKLAVHDTAPDNSWVEVCVRYKGVRDIAVYRITLVIQEVNELGFPGKV